MGFVQGNKDILPNDLALDLAESFLGLVLHVATEGHPDRHRLLGIFLNEIDEDGVLSLMERDVGGHQHASKVLGEFRFFAHEGDKLLLGFLLSTLQEGQTLLALCCGSVGGNHRPPLDGEAHGAKLDLFGMLSQTFLPQTLGCGSAGLSPSAWLTSILQQSL